LQNKKARSAARNLVQIQSVPAFAVFAADPGAFSISSSTAA